MKKVLLLSILIGTVLSTAMAQYSQYKNKKDSTEYPYFFPILGKEAVQKGFDIPYPMGLMVNSFYGVQNMMIDNIAVGFSFPDREIPLTDISDFIEFEEVKATAYSVTVRPDIWVFPFLDVYGVFGKSYATTLVKLTSPITLESTVHLEGFTSGVGLTGAFGIGKYFTVMDGNWVWTNMKQFKEPVRTSTFSLRYGRAFEFGKPENHSNVAFWVGAMRMRLGSETHGKMNFEDVFDDQTAEKRDEVVAEYRAWYDDINPIREPVKYKVATEVFNPIFDKIEAADGSSEVEYKLDKKPVSEWNMLIGAQYQINKSWQFRTEAGILGDRTSLLLSLNYRFGINGGNKIYDKLVD